MWTRIYLALIAVRLYFAFSPSYIHPDENFQGPEVIAGRVFGYSHEETWEFSSENPVRSVFPLWIAYGFPMVVLKWLLFETGHTRVAPKTIYYLLRGVMFMLSFVLEDWAMHELVHSPRHRKLAVILVASSYVTWTYQTHTFSNSIETIVVLWSLVLIQRILETKERSSVIAAGILGFLSCFGIFNRITFPAFIVAPGLYLVPHFLRKPVSLAIFLVTLSLTLLAAVYSDTNFYNPQLTYRATLHTLLHNPVLAPLNSLLYNSSAVNLSRHGLHPWYQHIVVNLPMLLAPALPLLFIRRMGSSNLLAALTGTIFLSFFPHQEARFLVPVVPLLLCSIHLPFRTEFNRLFVSTWIIFNVLMGLLMGIYHQGGVVPMQIWLGEHAPNIFSNASHPIPTIWWRTYSPPVWLGSKPSGTVNIMVMGPHVDLMGTSAANVLSKFEELSASCASRRKEGTFDLVLVAPRASKEIDQWQAHAIIDAEGLNERKYAWRILHEVKSHVGLDQLDIPEEGFWGTWETLVARRGLVAWRVTRNCSLGSVTSTVKLTSTVTTTRTITATSADE